MGLMELQLKHRVELLLAKERLCLECHEKELAVLKFQVLYLVSVTAEPEFAERTQWRSRLPPLPKWPSRRKFNKKRPRVSSGDRPDPKRKCSTRSKVAGIFMSGTTAALIRESFPKQKGVVVSETAPVAENLFDMSLEEILSDVEWESTVEEILTPQVSLVVGDAVKDPERLEPVEPVLDVEPEKEKTPAASRSRCLRSSATGRVKRKLTKKRRIHTQDMILEGMYWSGESAPESIENECLLLGLTRDVIGLD